MTETLVIYHGGCRDGFCAAWVVWKYLIDNPPSRPHSLITYHPGFYGQPAPDVRGKHVIIVDFCYSELEMATICGNAEVVTWLDHHKTAQKIADDWVDTPTCNHVFDNSRSGAGIVWDYFFPNEPRPWLVDYVEDRDLWLHKLQYSNEINAFIACLEFDFNIWDNYSKITIGDAAISGKVALMKTEQYVREVCKNVYFVNFDGNRKPTEAELNAILSDEPRHYDYENISVVNICQVDCSEVLHELCVKYPDSQFSMYWFKRADGMYQYGLRSVGDFDVSVVAKLFGGGGHKNASGFQLNYLLEELK